MPPEDEGEDMEGERRGGASPALEDYTDAHTKTHMIGRRVQLKPRFYFFREYLWKIACLAVGSICNSI